VTRGTTRNIEAAWSSDWIMEPHQRLRMERGGRPFAPTPVMWLIGRATKKRAA
jgi:hypothetical protein